MNARIKSGGSLNITMVTMNGSWSYYNSNSNTWERMRLTNVMFFQIKTVSTEMKMGMQHITKWNADRMEDTISSDSLPTVVANSANSQHQSDKLSHWMARWCRSRIWKKIYTWHLRGESKQWRYTESYLFLSKTITFQVMNIGFRRSDYNISPQLHLVAQM